VKLTVNLATIAGMLKIRLSFKDAQGIGLIGLVLLVIGSALIVNLGPHSEWLEGLALGLGIACCSVQLVIWLVLLYRWLTTQIFKSKARKNPGERAN
jgi:hypothetical protein